jgi:hypothetical protein
LAALDKVQVMVGNLPANRLGVTIGYQILIDANASGYGWSIDVSAQSPVDPGRMDLLTVVAHELGNAMGFPEDARETDAVTSPILSAGSRHLPGESPTAGLMPAPAAGTADIGAPAVPAAAVPAAVAASESAAARVMGLSILEAIRGGHEAIVLPVAATDSARGGRDRSREEQPAAKEASTAVDVPIMTPGDKPSSHAIVQRADDLEQDWLWLDSQDISGRKADET